MGKITVETCQIEGLKVLLEAYRRGIISETR